jgi:transcriptional regulator with XRE-family HTH domain
VDDLSTVGKRLAHARSQKRLLQTDVAAQLGMKNTAQISQWESDRYIPNAKRLGELAKVLGTTTEWLISGNGKAPVSGSVVRERPGGYLLLPPMPEWLDRLIDNTMLELARAGATNEQARYIRDVLRSDATLRFVLRDDNGEPRSLDEQQSQIHNLIVGMRFWVERSQLAGSIQPQATPGGAPIAPVIPTQDPGAAKPNVAQPGGKKK